jgi:hypothetical protein
MRGLSCAVFIRFSCLIAVLLLLASGALSQVNSQSSFPTFSKIPRVVPKVGDSIPPRHDSTACVIAAAQIDPCYFVDVNGITYKIAYRSEGNAYRVTYVETSDLRFITPQGLRVGDVIAISKEDDLILAPYFAVYANRGEVWIPMISWFLDQVTIVSADGKDTRVPVNQLHFGDGEIHVRISAFVQRDGAAYGGPAAPPPKL